MRAAYSVTSCDLRILTPGPLSGDAPDPGQQLNQAGLASIAQRLHDAAAPAFLHSFAGGCLVAAAVAAAGALAAFALLPARPRPRPDKTRPPADTELQPIIAVEGGDTADTGTP